MRSLIRRVFSMKIFTRVMFAIAAIATITMALVIYENWRGRRAWDACRTAAEARGEKLFLTDFVPADLPDSQNYAAAPVIRALFGKHDGTQSPQNPFGLPTKISPPSAADIVKGKRLDLTEWKTYFLGTKLLTEESGNAARDVLRALEKYEPALQQLRDASNRPGCKFPTKWKDGFAAELPHLLPLRSAGILFSLRMSANLALGDSAAAYSEFRHALRLHTALGSEPSLIAGLTRVAILGHLEAAVWDGLAAGQWAETELPALENDLAALRLLEDCRFAISTERGAFNQELQRLATAGSGQTRELLNQIRGMNSERTALSRVGDRLFQAVHPDGWFFQNMVRGNEYFDSVLAPFGKGDEPVSNDWIPPGQPADDWLRSIGAQSGPRKYYYLFLNIMLPALDSVQASYLAAHTQAQQTRLGCALERFRRARGGLPESLDALVPDYIPAVPKDVCDGNPLRYRRTADGYDLWSVGADRKDDGGKTVPDKGLRQQPDWLWRMPARPKAP